MAEHPDVTLVRRGYAAFNTGDVDTLREILAEDAVQHMVGDNLVSGDVEGRDAILAMYGRIAELTEGTYRAEIQQVFSDGGGTVVVVHRQTATRGGKHLDNLQALIFTVLDGKVVDLHDTSDDPAIDDAFYS